MTDDSEVPAQRQETGGGHLTVSIAICSNRPGSLHAAVASVLANTAPPFELVVVAQSGDPTWAHGDLESFQADPRLRIVYDTGRGLSRARNIALSATTGDIVIFTDDDCVVHPDWVEAHTAIYRAQPDVMMVFGRVAPPDGYDEAEGMVPTFDPVLEVGTPRLRGSIALGMGANMSLRRALTEQVGLFDEVLGPGAPLQSADDFDMALRASAAGLRVIADSRPIVIHAEGIRQAGTASRTLWQRDGFALGALLAKQLRMRHWAGATALVGFLGQIGFNSARRVTRGRRPYGVKMSTVLFSSAAHGLARGLRQRLDHAGGWVTFSLSR